MALINYLTRVHFGDGVLPEALRAELESRHIAKPFFLFETDEDGASSPHSELNEAVLGALPGEACCVFNLSASTRSREENARKASAIYEQNKCDAVIAVGGSRVMHFAKLVRVCVAYEENVSRFSTHTHGGRRLRNKLPLFLAAPDLFGIGASISTHCRLLLSDGTYDTIESSQLRADVVVCDPTFALGETHSSTSAAAVDAMTHCLEAYLAPGFNPPAEGIAIDGLRRVLKLFDRLKHQELDLDGRRQLMISCLDGALAMEKGAGHCAAIADYVMAYDEGGLTDGEIKRVVMPAVLNFTRHENAEIRARLKGVLNIPKDIAAHIEDIFSDLPLAPTLSELGDRVKETKAKAVTAALQKASSTSAPHLSADSLMILNTLNTSL